MMHNLNIYSRSFVVICPVNDLAITYHLRIETNRMIKVEDINEAIELHKRGFHEDIADDMIQRFGGHQVMTAHHHGVNIETHRVEAAPRRNKRAAWQQTWLQEEARQTNN